MQGAEDKSDLDELTSLRPTGSGRAAVQAERLWLRDFHPGWFGAVMGTAVIGIIASMNPGKFASWANTMRYISVGATVLAAALFVVIAIPYLSRWLIHSGAAWKDMRDPVAGPLHGTFPGAILVLAAAVANVGPREISVGATSDIVAGLAVVGVPLALAISLLFAYLLFTLDLPDVRLVNGGWFIPPVVTIIVPVVLLTLLGDVAHLTARLLLFAAYAFWGIGFLLFLLVMGLLHDRLVTQALPPAEMAPSLWIVLGPVGVGTSALIGLGHATPEILGPSAAVMGIVSLLGASILWGFGAWWLLVALMLLGRYIRRGGVPYGIGWWAFTFPLGALTLATVALGRAWSLAALADISLAMFVLLVLLWLIVTVRTLDSLAKGTLWVRTLPASPPKT